MAMPQSQPTSRKQPRCPDCGEPLPAGVPAGHCPKCLLRAGLATEPGTGPGGTLVLPLPPSKSGGSPRAGDQLGHYEIVRTLGSGGMGTVFEAEDLETGRRVALKVLSHTLDQPEARERFF